MSVSDIWTPIRPDGSTVLSQSDKTRILVGVDIDFDLQILGILLAVNSKITDLLAVNSRITDLIEKDSKITDLIIIDSHICK